MGAVTMGVAAAQDSQDSARDETDPAQTSPPSAESVGTVEDDETVKQESVNSEIGAALSIGSKAPDLHIQHWISDGNGQYESVTRFRPGKIYVLEFWATWCVPCIKTMPHLAALQQEYSDKIQVISVTRENLDTVDRFLNREFKSPSKLHDELKEQLGKQFDRVSEKEADASTNAEHGDTKPTYRDLTSVYCLTSDPDESTSNDYMVAAGQTGIPCAFLIGTTGKIEWIGHPMLIDEPLDEVLQGTWDREAFGRSFRSTQQADRLESQVVRWMRKGRVKQALELVEKGLADSSLSENHDRFHTLKLQILVNSEDHEEQAVAYLKERLADPTQNASAANDLAWTIYQYADAGRFEDDDVTQQALELAQSKVENSGETKPYLLDTVAHLLFIRGNIDDAIVAQRQAVAMSKSEGDEDMVEFLQELLEQADAN